MSFALLLPLAVGCATTAALVPVAAALLRRWRVVDAPDGRRKLHGRLVPRGVGVAVFCGFAAAAGASAYSGVRFDGAFLAAFVAACGLICAVGLLDDAFGLRGRQKLVGQLAAACLVVAFGGTIGSIDLLGFRLDLGPLAVPFTLFWLLGAINAINLIDGMDGFATIVAAVNAAALGAISVHTGHAGEAMLAAGLVGAAAGFLPYNLPPARVFLGDAGSMMIGLALGTIAYRGSMKGPAALALAAPLAVWAIPAFDVLMAIVRRKLTGRSVYATDRGHLHHCLSDRGLGASRVLCLVAILSAVTAAGALTSVVTKNEWAAVVSVTAVCGLLVLGRLFGHSECSLFANRAKSFAASLVSKRHGKPGRPARQTRTRLRGNREWESLWATLVTFAERFELTSVSLDVNHPALREEYFATWRQEHAGDLGEQWRSDIPLVSDVGLVGHLRIAGRCREQSVCDWMAELIAGLKPFETQMIDLLEAQAAAGAGEASAVVATAAAGGA